MNFTEALESMIEGKKVRVRSWGNEKYYWHMPDSDKYTMDNLWFIKDFEGNDVCFIMSWVLSKDWEVYEFPEDKVKPEKESEK